MGKLTISIAIFNSYVKLPEGGHNGSSTLPNSASSGMFGKNFESEGASFPRGCEESSDSSGPAEDLDFEDPWFARSYSYAHLSVISTYNPIYRINV